MDDLLADSVAALFRDHATPAAVRRAASEGLDRKLWQLASDAGFDKALVPETQGGAGLSLKEVAAVLSACGRYAAPIPLGEAILAHGFAGVNGVTLPDGAVTAAPVHVQDSAVCAGAVPWGGSADWVLGIETGGRAFIFEAAKAQCTPHAGLLAANECDMRWRVDDAHAVFAPPAGSDWRLAGAALRTAEIAGVLDAVLELTIRYASERHQFGRALSNFQAIQQQIALLAEDTFASRMAAAVACDSTGVLPNRANVAAAKVVASEAAVRACAIAHAIHGAIGMTAEYDLQLFTSRLLAWRMQYGSEKYWAHAIGSAIVADERTTWEFVRGA